MKKVYDRVELIVTTFSEEDVITTSGEVKATWSTGWNDTWDNDWKNKN